MENRRAWGGGYARIEGNRWLRNEMPFPQRAGWHHRALSAEPQKVVFTVAAGCQTPVESL